MSGFQSPNYTQTPNDFFTMLPDMEESEARVTLVMIRQTFGFHKEQFKMGLNKLAAATGLSRNAAKAGADAAEKRGTFMRTNPEEQGEAEWSLVVTPSTIDQEGSQPLTTPWSTTDSQVGVKESIKENKNKERGIRSPDFSKMSVKEAYNHPTLKLYREATDYFPGSILWEEVDKFVTANNLTFEKLHAAAVAWAAAGYKEANVRGILEWARDGIPDKHQIEIARKSPGSESNPFAPLIKYMQKKEAHDER